MKVGIISDIHGNLPALEAVLTELAKEGTNTLLCAGDIVGTLGWSEECVALTRLCADKSVFGNHDANIFPQFQESNESLEDEYELVTSQLSPESFEWLQSLPAKRVFVLGGHNTTLVHAHPTKQPHHGFPAQHYLSPRHYTRAGSDKESEVVIHGHTHDQHGLKLSKFEGQSGLILNPGSVGVPWYKPAEYAVFDPVSLDYELRTVEYDTDRNKQRFRELDLDGWRE